MASDTQTGTSWGGIEGLIEAAKQPPTAFAQALARPFIIQAAEMYSRFLVWDDEQFLGFMPSRDAAIELAHKQKPGTSVNICDKESVFQDHRDSFAVIAGSEGTVGPLSAQIIQNGLGLAAQVLAENITVKRDIMLKVHGELGQKYGGNMPPLDSPPSLDRETWERVASDFENAKIWRDRFYGRHQK